MRSRILLLMLSMVMTHASFALVVDHGVTYLGQGIYKYEILFDEPQQNVTFVTERNGAPDLNVDFTGSLQIKDGQASYSYYKNDYNEGDMVDFRFDFIDPLGSSDAAPSVGFDSHTVGSGGISHDFSETFSEAMSFVELHIIRNGEGFSNFVITDSETNNGDGSYTYNIVLDEFQNGDTAQYRIYARNAANQEFFVPGPTHNEMRVVEMKDSTGGTFPSFTGQLDINGFQDVFLTVNETLFTFDLVLPEDTIFTVLPGDGYTVVENGIIPTTSGTLTLGVQISKDGEVSSFQATANVIELDDRNTLMLNDRTVIEAAGLTLTSVMNQLAAQSGVNGVTGTSLFKQLWDTQNTQANEQVAGNINCDAQALMDGRAAVNGFPYVCPRGEGNLVAGDDAFVLGEMGVYRPIAIINRFDTRGSDFADCGEHRVIFGRNSDNARAAGRAFGRNFLIFEARMPNSMPGFAEGCSIIADFWTELSTAGTSAEQADLINEFYLAGRDGLAPVISIPHFALGAGQIRTNQFVDSRDGWLLREYKLDHVCSGTNCTSLTSVAVRAKDAFFGELFNGTLPGSTSEFAQRAGLFQQEFIDNIDSLFTNNMADLKVSGSDEFTQAESHASGVLTSESHFRNHFNEGAASEVTDFERNLQTAINGKLDASGNQLTIDQVLNRAMTQTCGGCHQPGTFGLTIPGALGDMFMPDGSIQSTFPNSASFVHFSEFSDVAGTSQALNTLFFPARFNDFKDILGDIQ